MAELALRDFLLHSARKGFKGWDAFTGLIASISGGGAADLLARDQPDYAATKPAIVGSWSLEQFRQVFCWNIRTQLLNTNLRPFWLSRLGRHFYIFTTLARNKQVVRGWHRGVEEPSQALAGVGGRTLFLVRIAIYGRHDAVGNR